MKSSTHALYRSLLYWQIDKLTLILSAMFFLPLFVHMIPFAWMDNPGFIFLPIFYAPLVAVLLYRPHVAFFASLMGPTINMLLIGKPQFFMTRLLTLELLVFVFVATILRKRFRGFWGIGLLSIIIAKFAAWSLLTFLTLSNLYSGAVPFFISSLMQALPGICVLVLINLFVVRLNKG